MKIRLDLLPGNTAEVIKDEQGNIIGLDINPLFMSSRGQSVVALFAAASQSGKRLHDTMLSVSGASGQMRMSTRNEQRVVPFVDTVAAPADKKKPNAPTN